MPNNTFNDRDFVGMPGKPTAALAIIGTVLVAVPLWLSNVTGWLAYAFAIGLWAGLAAIIAAVITAIVGRRQITRPLPWVGIGSMVVGLILFATGFAIAWTSSGGVCAPGGTCFNPAIQQAQMLWRAAAVLFVAGAVLLGLDIQKGMDRSAATEPLK